MRGAASLPSTELNDEKWIHVNLPRIWHGGLACFFLFYNLYFFFPPEVVESLPDYK